ncbi:hypothetical protein [Clostridium thermarum]|uniref:hypothetical protein n=1 Tax=Clostridium thermarum TaxID=1716543 RepID=UPI001FAAC5EA|nr:hypothetical protein [Clostridium thermarum]
MDINNGNKKRLRKAIWSYLIISAAAVVIDKIYDLFGHGVDSAAMTWMFLYPLLGGALFYFIIDKRMPNFTKITGYKLFINLYNSGIATLTLASMLKGIFEIAGTNSPHLKYYYVTGGVFIASGLIILFIMDISRNKID